MSRYGHKILATAILLIARALMACDLDVGEKGFGVAGRVYTSASLDPVPNAGASLDDPLPEARWPADSVGNFQVETLGCGERRFFVGAPGYHTYDTFVVSIRCRSIENLVIELEPTN